MGRNAVRVISRMRPTDSFANDVIQLHDDQKTVNVHTVRRGGTSDVINNTAEDHAYKLDLVMKDVSQESVFDLGAADIVKSVMQGYNGTVMCYGQTGAGKTYTMMGGTDYRTRGVIPRAVKAVFDEIQAQPDKTFDVKVSFIEVYIERIRDLLAPGANEDYAIQEDTKGNITIRGVEHKKCTQEAEVLAHLFEGNSNRATAEHVLNAASSRSHCIFTLHITSRSRVESESASVVSKLHLIDLAGSERLSKTASEGQIMKEAQFINKSLTFLEQVVMALGTSQKSHVPFRQSKLTNILKDSLGGNSKTTMIANVWPEGRHVEETVSTFKFATRMMKVQTDASINVVLDPQTQIRQLQRQINELKAELQMQNQLMGKSHIVYEGDIGEDERFEMEKTVQNYISGSIAEVPVRSLREVTEYFKVFKAFADTRDAEARAQAPPGSAPSADQKNLVSPNQPVPPSGKRNSQAGIGQVDGAGGLSVGVAAPSKNLKEILKTNQGSPSKHGGANASAYDISSPDAHAHSGIGSDIDESSIAQHQGGIIGSTELPDKNVAFNDFKNSEGQKFVAQVKDAQTALNGKKKHVFDLGNAINDVKAQIDSTAIQLEQRRLDRQARGEDEVVDDEEFTLVHIAKERKQEYREYYDALSNAKAEREILAKTVDAAKQRLLIEFENWYESVFGGAAKQAKIQTSIKSLRGAGAANVDDDDALDEGEKFEILELNRVMSEDPDSVAFYSAKKLTQTKQTMRKSHGFTQRK